MKPNWVQIYFQYRPLYIKWAREADIAEISVGECPQHNIPLILKLYGKRGTCVHLYQLKNKIRPIYHHEAHLSTNNIQTVSDVEPPLFELEMLDVSVEEGEKAFFDVRVTGLPDPEVRW